MANGNQFQEIRYANMKHVGVRDPEKIDEFIEKIYGLLKNEDFSIIEAKTIVDNLHDRISIDKDLILRESLKNVEKYNKEG